MAVRLSALRAVRPLLPGRFLVLISVRGWVDPRAIVRLEWLGHLKNPKNSLDIEPATFRLEAYFILFFTSYCTLKCVYITMFNRHGNARSHVRTSAFRQSGNGILKDDYGRRWIRRGRRCMRTLKQEGFSNIHCDPSQVPTGPTKRTPTKSGSGLLNPIQGEAFQNTALNFGSRLQKSYGISLQKSVVFTKQWMLILRTECNPQTNSVDQLLRHLVM
jgi:hypothetical protein